MDLLSLLRTLGGLGVVLGILAGALWLVRRFDLRLPGRSVGARDRRLELVETLPIDGRRMVALVRRDGREHLVLIAPEGHLILESAVVRDATDDAAAALREAARAEASALREEQRVRRVPPPRDDAAGAVASFGALVDRAEPAAGGLQAMPRLIARFGAIATAGVDAAIDYAARAITLAAPGARAVGRSIKRVGRGITFAAQAKAAARASSVAMPAPVARPEPPPPPRSEPPTVAAKLTAATTAWAATACSPAPYARPTSKRARRRRLHQEKHVA